MKTDCLKMVGGITIKNIALIKLASFLIVLDPFCYSIFLYSGRDELESEERISGEVIFLLWIHI